MPGKSFSKLLPEIIFKTDFNRSGIFATTKGGLSFIGCVRQRPRTYFALGLGGKGIAYSVITA